MQKFSKWLRTNQGVGVFLCVVFGSILLYLELSPWAHRKLRDGFTLGFFPMSGIVLLLIFSITLLVDRYRKETMPGLKNLTVTSVIYAVLTVILCWVFFSLVIEIGFLIIAFVFLAISIYVMGLKSWHRCIVTAAVITGAVFIIFTLLGIELPTGIIPLNFSIRD